MISIAILKKQIRANFGSLLSQRAQLKAVSRITRSQLNRDGHFIVGEISNILVSFEQSVVKTSTDIPSQVPGYYIVLLGN